MVGTDRRLWSVVLESAFVSTFATYVTFAPTNTALHLPRDTEGRRSLPTR